MPDEVKFSIDSFTHIHVIFFLMLITQGTNATKCPYE